MALEIDQWNAQFLRLSLFLKRPSEAAGLWKSVVGEDPEIDEHRPRENVYRQVGSFADGQLTLTVQSLRIDWLLTPPPVTPQSPQPQIYFADFGSAAASFDVVLARWIEARPELSASRLAYGLTALYPVADRLAAYELLSDLLPSVTLDGENSSEFVYQINRPKPSRTLVGAKLNRLMTWHSIMNRALVFTVGQNVPISLEEGAHFVSFTGDFSTPADGVDDLDVGKLLPIYEELREMALGNLKFGELP